MKNLKLMTLSQSESSKVLGGSHNGADPTKTRTTGNGNGHGSHGNGNGYGHCKHNGNGYGHVDGCCDQSKDEVLS